MTEWDAEEYARRSSLQKAMAQEVILLLQLNPHERIRILDVGCGEGKITAQIAERARDATVVGVDPSHDMIRFAAAHFEAVPNLRFEVADARRLPFEKEFDLVVSFNALHWIPDQEAALRSIHSAIARGGKAQLRLVPKGPRKSLEDVVEETRKAPRWKAHFADFHDPYLHLTPEEYAALAEDIGFRVLRVSTTDHAWNFGSRAAFVGFSAVGLVAWTDRLPATERPDFINDALDRYQKVTGDGNASMFRFYQIDASLLAI